MNILVLGCGAIGSCISADLIKAGYPITVIDPWIEQVIAIKNKGILINLKDKTIQTPPINAYHVSELNRLNSPFEIVFLATKAGEAIQLTNFIKPFLSDDAVLIPLMNGMMNSSIASIIGKDRLLGSVIELSAESFEPGVVKRKTTHENTWIGIGELDGQVSDRLNVIKNLLSHTANVDFSKNIENAKWTKLVTNAMVLAPFAMLQATSYDSLNHPKMQALILKVGEEAIAVGKGLGYQLEEIFGLSAIDMQKSPIDIASLLVNTLIGHIGKQSQNATTQDIIKMRKTETQFINGLVVSEGKNLGIPTLANIAICETIHEIENQTLAPKLSNIDLTFQRAKLI